MDMDTQKLPVTYIYRNTDAFSIEKVFDTVADALPEDIALEKHKIPCRGVSVLKLFRNILSVRPFRKKIVHVTGDAHYTILGASRKRSILTVHDLGILDAKKGFAKFLLWLLWFYLPVRHATVITCISEATKQALLDTVKVSPDKIVVVRNPVGANFTPEPMPDASGNIRLLHIGTKPNKNLRRLATALHGINGVELRIIGIIPDEDKKLLDELNINYSAADHLSDSEIVDEYRKCHIVCFISTFEGFGMPILEGQRTGRVVLTSNISPMKEVAGNSAVLVDPFNVDDIREKILQLLSNHDNWQDIISRGNANAEIYSPEAVAGEYAAIYRRIQQQ